MRKVLNVCQVVEMEERFLVKADRAASEGDFQKANRFIDWHMTIYDRIASRARR
jgi:hypothetical protein